MMTPLKFLSGNPKRLNHLRADFCSLLFSFKLGFPGSWCDWFSIVFAQFCYELCILNLFLKVEWIVLLLPNGGASLLSPISLLSLPGEVFLLPFGGDWSPWWPPWLPVKGRTPSTPLLCSPCSLQWYHWFKELPHQQWMNDCKSSSCQ